LLGGVFLFGTVCLQLLYWKTITGKFIVFSYQEIDYFNFLNPEILNFLFSVRKGLFFWSPILLSIFPGIYYLRKKAPTYFIPTLVYLPLNIYMTSSWSNWWYGGSFGSRPFVEAMPVFALGLCALFEGVKTNLQKWLVILYVYLCAMYTTWFMLKYWVREIPFDGTTWEIFFRALFSG